MAKKEYYSIKELADIMGLSRIAVYQRVKKGQIKAIKIGRSYAIPAKVVAGILGNELTDEEKHDIKEAVKKTVKEYGETLRLLGKEEK
ncbi:MAG: helix-turn-helix domain-containing protein [Candidatus Margulisiibacteriota bacterium]